MNHTLMNQGVPGATAQMTDTVTIQLRNTIAPYEVMYSYRTLLLTNGYATVNVPSFGTYFLVVKQRNGLETWSKNPVSPGIFSTSYNFTTSQDKAFGDNQVELQPGIWGVFAGDLYPDGNIDLLDLLAMDDAITNFNSDYLIADINGDGNVDLLDTPLIQENIRNFVYSVHP